MAFSARKYDHVTPLLRLKQLLLHWLRVPERSGSLSSWRPSSSGVLTSRPHGTSVPRRQHKSRGWCRHEAESAFQLVNGGGFQWLVAARSGIALSRSPLPARGTVYCRLSHHRSSSLSTFKRHLKTYLFATSYWWRCWPSCFFLCLPNTSSFCVLRVLAVFWTKRHANLFPNNHNKIIKAAWWA